MSETVNIIDPLKVINLPEVAARTGYGRRTVLRMLAEDAKEKSPGRRFPAPMKSRHGSNRLEWREKAIADWLDKREQT